MLKVNEAIKSNYLLFDANGNPATGKTVTASVYDETDTFYSSPAVSEIASTGIYQASFTPDTLGEWTIIFDCTNPNATDAMTYFIGMGQEPDILTEVAGLNGDAMRGTNSAALAATALSNATWTDAKAGYLTGNVYTRLGAPSGASVSADIATNLAAINALNDITAANVRQSICLTGDPANSIGKILYEIYINRLTSTRAGYLDTNIGSRSSHNAAAIWSVGARALTDKAGFTLESGEYTNIWNKDISAYTSAKAGAYLKTLHDDWLNGGRLDLLLDACSTHSAGDVLDVNISAYSGAGYAGTYLKTLYDDWLNGGRLDLLLDACSTHSAADVMNVNISTYSTAGYAGTYLKTLYDDWLNGGRLDLILDNIESLVDSAEATGPFSYLDAGGEQTVKEDTTTTRRHIYVEVSNRNMAQIGTFRIYRKVDGSNYDLYTSQAVKVAAGSDRAWDAEFTTNQAWKVTYEEDSDEGAARNIPYNVITQVIE